MIFACGVRFIRFSSALLNGYAGCSIRCFVRVGLLMFGRLLDDARFVVNFGRGTDAAHSG